MTTSRHPSLHSPGGAGDLVGLSASRCSVCGRVALPPETFGCRRCGADHQSLQLDGSATVRVSTVVHNDPLGSIPTPYPLARLELDTPDGDPLVVTGLLTEPLGPGRRVRARLIELGDDRLEVRFEGDP